MCGNANVLCNLVTRLLVQREHAVRQVLEASPAVCTSVKSDLQQAVCFAADADPWDLASLLASAQWGKTATLR